MPAYAYRCRTCEDSFEVRRSMTDVVRATVPCPQGHPDTTRVFSAVAVGGRAAGGAPDAATAPTTGGGCCGGGCCG